jgi:branched-chain amino acid transport system ATP-binding protein
MTESVLRIEGLTKRFGGLIAVNAVDFVMPGGELHAIIGPNGAGKTTLFNLISGLLSADAGRILFAGRDITGERPHRISRLGIARTLQVKSVFNGLSVYDNVWIAAQTRRGFLHPLRPAHAYGDTDAKVRDLLAQLELEGHAKELAGNLSYGDVALLEIAIALATDPRLLLLDEPVAGMSPSETARATARIRDLARRVDVILIEHDMEVVFSIADRVTVMHQGAILAAGRPDEIRRDRRVQDAYLGEGEDE